MPDNTEASDYARASAQEEALLWLIIFSAVCTDVALVAVIACLG